MSERTSPRPAAERSHRMSDEALETYSGGLLRTGPVDRTARIVVLEGNPHKVGSNAHRRFSTLRNGLSVAAYVAAVASLRDEERALIDIAWWRRHGSIGLIDARAAYGPEPETELPPPAAPEPERSGFKLARKAAAGLGRQVGKAVRRA